MTRLTRLALDHPSITILLTVLLFFAGTVAALDLNQELIPEIGFPQATVVTIWPGASAGEMTSTVTRPIEDALSRIDDVDVVQVSSNTSESFSAVTVLSEYGTDQDKLRDAINAQLITVRLPDGAEDPEILLFDFGDLPVVSMSVSGEIDPGELERLVDQEVVPELEKIDGVAEISVSGTREDKVFVDLQPEKLAAYGLSLAAIKGVLQANNLSIPAGALVTEDQSIPLQVANRISSEEELRRLVLVPPGAAGGPAGSAGSAMPGTDAAPGQSGDQPPQQPVDGADEQQPAAGDQGSTAGATDETAAGADDTAIDTDAGDAEAAAAELPPIWLAFGAQFPEDITADMLAIALDQVPDAVNELTVAQLRSLPFDTVANLSDEQLEAVSAEARAELESLREQPAPLAEVPEGAITLGDVASIERRPEEAATINRTDGEPSLGVSVLKESDANTVTVVNDVLEKLDDLENDSALNDLAFNVVFEQGSYVEESLAGVRNEGLLGALFAVLVILVFLSFSVRATLVTAISIPTSIFFAFLLMRMSGLTLNLLTLSGLTIAVGRIVDDAIVVTENIFRHLQRGDRRAQAVFEGTREVTTAITAATLVTVAVFLPLGFVGGLIREFFLPFGLTATYALLASLLVAVTIVPVLAKFLLSRSRVPEEKESRLQRWYAPSVEWALDHRFVTLAAATIFFVLSLGLLRFIPQTFIPGFGEPSLSVELALPPGTNLETTDGLAKRVESVLAENNDIDIVQATIGGGFTGGFDLAAGGDTSAASFIASFKTADLGFFERLTDDELDTDAVTAQVREDLEAEFADSTPSVTLTVSAASLGGPGGDAFDLQIRSADDEALRQANAAVLTAITDPDNWESDEGWFSFGDGDDGNGDGGIPIINIESNLTAARPVLSIDVDAGAALARGLTTAQVAFAMREAIDGQSLGDVSIGANGEGESLEVIARYPDDLIGSVEALSEYMITGPAGPVRLGDIAEVTERPGPVQITRIDGERAALITGEITDEDTFGVIADADRIIADLNLDDEFGEDVVEVGAGAQSSQQTEGFRDMVVALLFSIVIVYVILVITFKSIVHPFTILFSLPFAFSGAFIALAITQRPLSISSMIGLLMLVGIVVTNAIVLIDLVQQYRKRGMDARTALVRGGTTRLRPILMTAVATVLALLPQALGLSGEGALIASDLATVVIGGLISSTLLTLLIVPVVYSLLDKLSTRGDTTEPYRDPRAPDGPAVGDTAGSPAPAPEGARPFEATSA